MLDQISELLTTLPALSRTIEIGCGPQARFTRILATRFKDLTATDPVLSLRQIARLRTNTVLHHVRFLPMAIEAVPAKHEKFDLAVMAYGIHHVAPAARVGLLDAVSRLLAPGGRFLVIEDLDIPCDDVRQQHFQDYHKTVIALDQATGRSHFPLLSPSDIAAMFETQGWTLQDWKIIHQSKSVETPPEVLSMRLLQSWHQSRSRLDSKEPETDIRRLCEQLERHGVATPPCIWLIAISNDS